MRIIWWLQPGWVVEAAVNCQSYTQYCQAWILGVGGCQSSTEDIFFPLLFRERSTGETLTGCLPHTFRWGWDMQVGWCFIHWTTLPSLNFSLKLNSLQVIPVRRTVLHGTEAGSASNGRDRCQLELHFCCKCVSPDVPPHQVHELAEESFQLLLTFPALWFSGICPITVWASFLSMWARSKV